MSPHYTTEPTAGMNVEINSQTLKKMKKFPPAPGVKKIMVTGGNGFIGSWIIRALTITYPDCYEIVSFDKLEDGASLKNTKMLNDYSNFSFFGGDITSPQDVASCLQTHEIDTIIHLAAQSNVDSSFQNPYGFTETNIHGTQVLLEVAKSNNVKKFIQMSSYEAYGASKAGPEGHKEEDALSPMNPYGAGKAAAEMLVNAFGNSSSLQTIIVRANNIYGPNQFPDKIIPKFAMLLRHGHKLPLQGSGDGSRRYLYVGDAANAFNFLLHKGVGGETYNLGSYDEVSHRELCETLLELVKPPGYDKLGVEAWIDRKPGRPYVDSGSRMDVSKLRALGWDQNVSFTEGLKHTVQWYFAHGDTWWGDAVKKILPASPTNGCTTGGSAKDVLLDERTNEMTTHTMATEGGTLKEMASNGSALVEVIDH